MGRLLRLDLSSATSELDFGLGHFVIPAGTASGTNALDTLFARWLREDMRRPSTAIFVVPGNDEVKPASE